MFYSGLLSITFRQLSAEEIIGLVQQAGLQGIEWGGDVHVPHGDTTRAREVRRMTEDAGLCLTAYGSYYRIASDRSPEFGPVLETAVELGVPTIRVWPGDMGTDKADEAYWEAVIAESRQIADQAQASGLTISYEYHPNTLTDTDATALRLIQAVDHPGIRTFWQPDRTSPVAQRIEGLKAVLPWLETVHTFYWGPGGSKDRLPLADGIDTWEAYLDVVRTTGRDHNIMMEFVRDDSPDVFLEDAQTLVHDILGGA